MTIVQILKTYGESTFDFVFDCLSYDIDCMDLQIKLNTLVENNKIRTYVNENDRTVYNLAE